MDSNRRNVESVAGAKCNGTRPYILCEANGSWVIVSSQAEVTTLVRSEFLTLMTIDITVLWDGKLCDLVKVYGCFGGTYCLHLQGQRVSQASSKLKVEAVHSSEMSINFYQTTQCHIPRK
jgi:hypothetical protein